MSGICHKTRMRITAGLGSLEDYELLVQAGADEVFCGYVPYTWNRRYANLLPLNRREVLYYHVQIGTWEEMKLLSRMAEHYGVPVAITLNALYYTQEQLPLIGQMIRELSTLGFHDYIIADIGLLLYLKKEKIACRVHMSGELGEWNCGTVELLASLLDEKESSPALERIIFHRKNTIADMMSIIHFGRKQIGELEYEAFILNEMCHFTGGFCNSLHCDEMVHICQLPYRLVPMCEKTTDMSYDLQEKAQEGYSGVGDTGCGLCALWRLRESGVTHLKVVGRGKSAREMAEDIKALRKALDLLETAVTEKEYMDVMKKAIFTGDCSHKCYYKVEQGERG